jgi:hypothetical protein
MKYLKSYEIFEGNLPIGSLSEEFYDLFIDYAEKYDLNWVPAVGAKFGWSDNKSEFMIDEDNTCVVLDIKFQKGYGLASDGHNGISKEFHNDMINFASKIEEFIGFKPTIKHEWNCKDYYKGSRLYQIAIDKILIKESNNNKSIENLITDIFSDLTDNYSINIKYAKSINGITVDLNPDWKIMSAANLKLAAMEIEKLKIFAQNYIPNITIVNKKNPSLRDRFSFLIKTKSLNEGIETEDINNILQDCQDLGLYTKVDQSNPSKITLKVDGESIEADTIKILIEHNPSEYSQNIFLFFDIKSSILHIIEYMKQNGYNKYIYQDQYTNFNNFVWIQGKNKSNTLPNDNDGIGIIRLTFYKTLSKNESFVYKDINYKYEWAMANSPIRRELEADIDNMLLDVKDLYYAVSTGWISDPCVWIGKSNRRRTFEMSEVSETINRIKEFLIFEGFTVSESDLKDRDGNPTQIYIYFTKD